MKTISNKLQHTIDRRGLPKRKPNKSYKSLLTLIQSYNKNEFPTRINQISLMTLTMTQWILWNSKRKLRSQEDKMKKTMTLNNKIWQRYLKISNLNLKDQKINDFKCHKIYKKVTKMQLEKINSKSSRIYLVIRAISYSQERMATSRKSITKGLSPRYKDQSQGAEIWDQE